MNSIHDKEKKLEEALEKLNSINTQSFNSKEIISNLDQQKNQLEIEKSELEIKYKIKHIANNIDLSLAY